MFAVTTPTIEGHPVQQYLGMVSGEAINGINALKDVAAGLRSVFGGRAQGYEKELQDAYASAVKEMMERAEAMGANAVVGVRVEYFALGNGDMLAAAATGTAVRI